MYLNVDLGEEIKVNLEVEKAIMPYIDACNIACGGHAGNEDTMRKCVILAKKNNVKIGAHPSYRDKENFGRKKINISPEDLKTSLLHQLRLLQQITEKEKTNISHVKMHGALYNDSANNEDLALLVVNTVKEFDKNIILFTPPDSKLSQISLSNNVNIHYEVFGDRNYNDDLSLVKRTIGNSLITKKQDLIKHIKSMIDNKEIYSIHGNFISAPMDTICMHSDHKGAIENIKLISEWISRPQND